MLSVSYECMFIHTHVQCVCSLRVFCSVLFCSNSVQVFGCEKLSIFLSLSLCLSFHYMCSTTCVFDFENENQVNIRENESVRAQKLYTHYTVSVRFSITEDRYTRIDRQPNIYINMNSTPPTE